MRAGRALVVGVVAFAYAGAGCSGFFAPADECTAAADTCPRGRVCQCFIGCSCVAGCKSDADCGVKQICGSNGDFFLPTNVCFDGCDSNDKCPPHHFCSDQAMCVPGCRDDAECSNGLTCLDGDCVTPLTRCHEDADCAAGSGCFLLGSWGLSTAEGYAADRIDAGTLSSCAGIRAVCAVSAPTPFPFKPDPCVCAPIASDSPCAAPPADGGARRDVVIDGSTRD
jgi:hypothetical protein